MTREKYQARKAAGLCAGYEACKNPPRPGVTLCGACKDRRNEAINAYRRRRKLAGFCAWGGCKEKPDGAGMCAVHQPRQTAHERKWQKRHRRAMKRNAKAYDQRRAEAGICRRCPRPLFTETLCRVHRDIDLERGKKRRRAAGVPVDARHRCSTCKEHGHRRTTCPLGAGQYVAVSIEARATSRKGWD